MKRPFLNIIHLLLIAAALGGVQLTHAQTAAATPIPPTGTIVDIQPREPPGKLKVSRERGDTPVDATIGMPIRRGDLLILAEGAKATIVCADKLPHEINKRSQPCPCFAGKKFERSKYGLTFIPRGVDTANSAFPVIISPRATRILNTRPTLRWSPVAKSTTDGPTTDPVYRVSILTDDMKPVWSKDGITNTEMAYPADVPALAPGEYLLLVSTGTRESDDEHAAGRGFIVLPTCAGQSWEGRRSPCLAQQVRNEERRIRNFNLPDDSTRLLIADLYASNGLYAEAIEELEKVSTTVKAPAVIRQLGDLYASVGLNREAERLYLEALSISQVASDLEARALTLRSLASSYENLGNFEQARAKYDEAIGAYEKLGDHAVVTELKRLRAILGER